MAEQTLTLGVDGGATRLNWIIEAQDGRRASGESVGANPNLDGWTAFLERLDALLETAGQALGGSPGPLTHLGLGLAGIDRPEQVAHLHDWLRRSRPGLQGCWVGNDALPALRAGAGRLEGIVLIAGTGSIAYGVAPGGAQARVGGWGDLLGDEGSGYWIGRMVLTAACRMTDGRQAPTGLPGRVLDRLQLNAPQELIGWVADLPPNARKRTIAALATLAVELAVEGDPAAGALLDRAAGHLAAHILALAAQLDALSGETPLGCWPVVCSGGVLIGGPALFDRLRNLLDARRFALIPLRDDPALGALLMARETTSDTAHTNI